MPIVEAGPTAQLELVSTNKLAEVGSLGSRSFVVRSFSAPIGLGVGRLHQVAEGFCLSSRAAKQRLGPEHCRWYPDDLGFE